MADDIAKALVSRYNGLFDQQASMRARWQEIADYYLPYKANIIRQRQQGQEARDHLFTGVGTRAGKRLAANLHGSLTSQAIPWFSWRDDSEALMENHDVAEWYEAATNIGYKKFHAPESNFNTQQHEFYIDLVFFHTAAKLFEAVLEPNGAFRNFAFKTIQVGTYVIDENIYGRVDTIMRRFDMTVRTAIARFGEGKLPAKITKNAEKKPDQKFPFLHVCMPAKDYQRIGGKVNKEYASIYVALTEAEIVNESDYKTFPFMVTRWDKAAGDLYGSGPAADALPDLKTLNKAREQTLSARGKALDPPLLVPDDGIVGDIDLMSGGYTVCRDPDKIRPLINATDFRFAAMEEDRDRQEINQAFFYDDLALVTSGKDPTAEEIITRRDMLERLLGPTMGRMETEDLNPMTLRAFDLLNTAGEFPPKPENLKKLSVRYEGPLAKSQRTPQVDAIYKTRTIAERFAATNPDVLDLFDDDQAIKIVADVMEYPKKAMRSDQDIAQRRKQRQMQQALQSMPEQVKNLGAGAASFANAAATKPEGVLPQ